MQRYNFLLNILCNSHIFFEYYPNWTFAYYYKPFAYHSMRHAYHGMQPLFAYLTENHKITSDFWSPAYNIHTHFILPSPKTSNMAQCHKHTFYQNLKTAVLSDFLNPRQGNIPKQKEIARERHKMCLKSNNIVKASSSVRRKVCLTPKFQIKISKKNKKIK